MAIRVMIIEDEMLVAMDIEEELVSRGYEVCATESSCETALEALDRERPDMAIIDMNLTDGPSFPVADRLAAANVPFIFLSGDDERALPDAHKDRPLLSKPVRYAKLAKALEDLATEKVTANG